MQLTLPDLAVADVLVVAFADFSYVVAFVVVA